VTHKIFDPTKPVQTRDGRKARIICTDSRVVPSCPIIALIENLQGCEYSCHRKADGTHPGSSPSHSELINTPVVRKEYRGVYRDGCVTDEYCTKLRYNTYGTDKCVGQFEYTYSDDEISDIVFVKREY